MALAIGLSVLSFAAGGVVTAVVLRRRQTPVPAPRPAPEPVLEPVVEPTMDLRLPPGDYGTRPIHRNPVMGIPTALPSPVPRRPVLALVPDLDPEPEPEVPVPQDEVRRMRVVRDVPDSDDDPTRPNATRPHHTGDDPTRPQPTRRESNR